MLFVSSLKGGLFDYGSRQTEAQVCQRGSGEIYEVLRYYSSPVRASQRKKCFLDSWFFCRSISNYSLSSSSLVYSILFLLMMCSVALLTGFHTIRGSWISSLQLSRRSSLLIPSFLSNMMTRVAVRFFSSVLSLILLYLS